MVQSPLAYRILGVLAPATRSHHSPAACDAAIPLVVDGLLQPEVSRLYADLPALSEQILDAGEVGRPPWKETTDRENESEVVPQVRFVDCEPGIYLTTHMLASANDRPGSLRLISVGAWPLLERIRQIIAVGSQYAELDAFPVSLPTASHPQ